MKPTPRKSSQRVTRSRVSLVNQSFAELPSPQKKIKSTKRTQEAKEVLNPLDDPVESVTTISLRSSTRKSVSHSTMEVVKSVEKSSRRTRNLVASEENSDANTLISKDETDESAVPNNEGSTDASPKKKETTEAPVLRASRRLASICNMDSSTDDKPNTRTTRRMHSSVEVPDVKSIAEKKTKSTTKESKESKNKIAAEIEVIENVEKVAVKSLKVKSKSEELEEMESGSEDRKAKIKKGVSLSPVDVEPDQSVELEDKNSAGTPLEAEKKKKSPKSKKSLNVSEEVPEGEGNSGEVFEQKKKESQKSKKKSLDITKTDNEEPVKDEIEKTEAEISLLVKSPTSKKPAAEVVQKSVEKPESMEGSNWASSKEWNDKKIEDFIHSCRQLITTSKNSVSEEMKSSETATTFETMEIGQVSELEKTAEIDDNESNELVLQLDFDETRTSKSSKKKSKLKSPKNNAKEIPELLSSELVQKTLEVSVFDTPENSPKEVVLTKTPQKTTEGVLVVEKTPNSAKRKGESSEAEEIKRTKSSKEKLRKTPKKQKDEISANDKGSAEELGDKLELETKKSDEIIEDEKPSKTPKKTPNKQKNKLSPEDENTEESSVADKEPETSKLTIVEKMVDNQELELKQVDEMIEDEKPSGKLKKTPQKRKHTSSTEDGNAEESSVGDKEPETIKLALGEEMLTPEHKESVIKESKKSEEMIEGVKPSKTPKKTPQKRKQKSGEDASAEELTGNVESESIVEEIVSIEQKSHDAINEETVQVVPDTEIEKQILKTPSPENIPKSSKKLKKAKSESKLFESMPFDVAEESGDMRQPKDDISAHGDGSRELVDKQESELKKSDETATEEKSLKTSKKTPKKWKQKVSDEDESTEKSTGNLVPEMVNLEHKESDAFEELKKSDEMTTEEKPSKTPRKTPKKQKQKLSGKGGNAEELNGNLVPELVKSDFAEETIDLELKESLNEETLQVVPDAEIEEEIPKTPSPENILKSSKKSKKAKSESKLFELVPFDIAEESASQGQSKDENTDEGSTEQLADKQESELKKSDESTNKEKPSKTQTKTPKKREQKLSGEDGSTAEFSGDVEPESVVEKMVDSECKESAIKELKESDEKIEEVETSKKTPKKQKQKLSGEDGNTEGLNSNPLQESVQSIVEKMVEFPNTTEESKKCDESSKTPKKTPKKRKQKLSGENESAEEANDKSIVVEGMVDKESADTEIEELKKSDEMIEEVKPSKTPKKTPKKRKQKLSGENESAEEANDKSIVVEEMVDKESADAEIEELKKSDEMIEEVKPSKTPKKTPKKRKQKLSGENESTKEANDKSIVVEEMVDKESADTEIEELKKSVEMIEEVKPSKTPKKTPKKRKQKLSGENESTKEANDKSIVVEEMVDKESADAEIEELKKSDEMIEEVKPSKTPKKTPKKRKQKLSGENESAEEANDKSIVVEEMVDKESADTEIEELKKSVEMIEEVKPSKTPKKTPKKRKQKLSGEKESAEEADDKSIVVEEIVDKESADAVIEELKKSDEMIEEVKPSKTPKKTPKKRKQKLSGEKESAEESNGNLVPELVKSDLAEEIIVLEPKETFNEETAQVVPEILKQALKTPSEEKIPKSSKKSAKKARLESKLFESVPLDVAKESLTNAEEQSAEILNNDAVVIVNMNQPNHEFNSEEESSVFTQVKSPKSDALTKASLTEVVKSIISPLLKDIRKDETVADSLSFLPISKTVLKKEKKKKNKQSKEGTEVTNETLDEQDVKEHTLIDGEKLTEENTSEVTVIENVEMKLTKKQRKMKKILEIKEKIAFLKKKKERKRKIPETVVDVEIIDEMLENREPVKKKKAVKTYEVAVDFDVSKEKSKKNLEVDDSAVNINDSKKKEKKNLEIVDVDAFDIDVSKKKSKKKKNLEVDDSEAGSDKKMSENIELPKDTKASKKSQKVQDGDSVGESEVNINDSMKKEKYLEIVDVDAFDIDVSKKKSKKKKNLEVDSEAGSDKKKMSEDIELPKDTKASKKSKKVKDGDSVGESEVNINDSMKKEKKYLEIVDVDALDIDVSKKQSKKKKNLAVDDSVDIDVSKKKSKKKKNLEVDDSEAGSDWKKMFENIEMPKDTKASKKSQKVPDGDSMGESEVNINNSIKKEKKNLEIVDVDALDIDVSKKQSKKKKNLAVDDSVSKKKSRKRKSENIEVDGSAEKMQKADSEADKVESPGVIISSSIPSSVDSIEIQNLFLKKKINLLSMRNYNSKTELCIENANQIGVAISLLSKEYFGSCVHVENYHQAKEKEAVTDDEGFRSCQVYIDNIPPSATVAHLTALFPRATQCDLPMKDHENKGFCILTFPNKAIAQKHLKLNGKVDLAGCKLSIYARVKDSSKGTYGDLLKELLIHITDLDSVLIIEDLPPDLHKFNLPILFPPVEHISVRSSLGEMSYAAVICKDSNQAEEILSKKIMWNDQALNIIKATKEHLDLAINPFNTQYKTPAAYLQSTLLLENLPDQTTYKDITELFPSSVLITLVSKNNYALVSFSTRAEMLEISHTKKKLKIKNKTIMILQYYKGMKRKSGLSKKDFQRLLHVRGFPARTTRDDLRVVFKNCKISMTKTKGIPYAVVKCKTEEKARDFLGKKLVVGGKILKLRYLRSMLRQIKKEAKLL